MFEKDDKRYIYWLINLYFEKKITTEVFCDEFYCSYSLEINPSTLNKKEEDIFYELALVTNRFSPFKSDFINYPKAFSSEQEVRQKILETYDRFKEEIKLYI